MRPPPPARLPRSRPPAAALLPVALIAAGLSCGPPPAPDATPTLLLPTGTTTAPAPEDPCGPLAKRITRYAQALRADAAATNPGLRGPSADRYLAEWPAWCARSLLEKARAQCEGALATPPGLAEGLRDRDEQRKAARFRVSEDGQWIVEWTGVHHVLRVWEALPDKLRLAWLLSPAEDCTPMNGGRVVCHVRFERATNMGPGQYLLVLDVPTNTLRRFDDVEGWQLQGNHLALASGRRLRRVDWTTLATTADVPMPKVEYPFTSRPELCAGGRSMLLNHDLVSLESGAVLASKLDEAGFLASIQITPDRSRLLACTGGSPVLVDAVTGRIQPISGGHKCGIAPSFTPDGRRAVGVDETVGKAGPDGRSPRSLRPFVIDVATANAQPFPAATFRAARRGDFYRVSFPADPKGRVCVSYAPDAGKGLLYYGPDPDGEVCPFQLDDTGKLSSAGKSPPDPLSARSLHLKGAEIARAPSPDGASVLIATAAARPRPDDTPSWDLRFLQVSVRDRKVLRDLHVERQDLALSWADPPILFVGSDWPDGMSFFGPTRAVLATSPAQVLDLATGALSQIEGEHLGARWSLTPDHTGLIDFATGARFSLDPDEAAYRAVKTYGRECPERPEDIPLPASR